MNIIFVYTLFSSLKKKVVLKGDAKEQFLLLYVTASERPFASATTSNMLNSRPTCLTFPDCK